MRLLVAALIAIVGYDKSTFGQTCAELESKSPAELVKYLNRERGSQASECVEHALRTLGDQKYMDAIPIILSYLDYRRDPTPSERSGVATGHT